ncbi:hypothetical protein P4054_22575 [Pseudomonas aeruginosa]|nr:hypothetical protein [Pseudomonas aeruginosa]
MSYLVLQRHANEQIVLTAHPDVSDEDLIRQIRDQGIAVCGRALGMTCRATHCAMRLGDCRNAAIGCSIG